MDIPIGEIRVTIFTRQIIYDDNNLNQVKESLLEDDGFDDTRVSSLQLVPSINMPIPIDKNSIPTEWDIYSKKLQMHIHFGPQKIDIIKVLNNKHSTDIEEEFCQKGSNIFSKIIEKFSLSLKRLAFAPTYTPEWSNEFNRNSFNSSIYRKKPFKNSKWENLLFKQVFRIEETLCDRKILINYLSEISEGQKIIEIKNNNQIILKKFLNITLDINTYPNENNQFSLNEMKAFFVHAPRYAKTFLEYYI